MITEEESIPTTSDAYLYASNVFYTQFNTIEFYVEDAESENVYFAILKTLFPNIVFEKIFPLNGKQNVLDESTKCLGDRKKIFIVDKDFDDLFNLVVKNDNLFYLENYSIENYLIEESSLVSYVVDESPKLKRHDVKVQLSFNQEIKKCGRLFGPLVRTYLIVQSWFLGIKNTKHPPNRFFRFRRVSTAIPGQLDQYERDVEAALKAIDGRMSLKGQLRQVNIAYKIKNDLDTMPHIPGKYILAYFKGYIEDVFDLHVRNIDSFAYQLAKLGTFQNLNFLKKAIEKYVA